MDRSRSETESKMDEQLLPLLRRGVQFVFSGWRGNSDFPGLTGGYINHRIAGNSISGGYRGAGIP